jgi:excisionase family DNA binding protein
VSALDEVLTPQEVADLLHLRLSTVHELARRGELPSVFLGRHRRFVRSDLVAYVDELRSARNVEAAITRAARGQVRRPAGC